MLRDAGDDQPPHNLSVILKCAILGSPLQRLTLHEIRLAMRMRFEYYANSGGWCNTIRHNLSTKRDEFERVPRPKVNDDSGGWWKVISGAEPRKEELVPTRRAPPAAGSSSSNRSRGQSFPNQSRQRRVEPWSDMTTTFTTSEDQGREAVYAQYAQGGQNAVNHQHQPVSSFPSTISVGSSTAQLSYRELSEGLVDVSRKALPGIHTLGLPGLGRRSGGQYHQTPHNGPYNSQQLPSDRGEDEESYWGEGHEEDYHV